MGKKEKKRSEKERKIRFKVYIFCHRNVLASSKNITNKKTKMRNKRNRS